MFRPKDVGKNKSDVAALAVQQMNPDLKGKIDSKLDKVGPETEDIFDDKFWTQLNIVVNALDNVEARTYVDRRCVFYKNHCWSLVLWVLKVTLKLSFQT